MQHPEIYFHVGLGKVASTYLQYDFFPKLKNVHYIQRTKYKRAKEIIAKGKHDTYLLSREFDRQLEREVSDFASTFPNTRPIILLRPHDSWIASQYRRFIKNGNHWTFDEFIDIKADKGAWKIDDLYFFPKIQALEYYFHHKPLVLFYKDFKQDPVKFFDQLAAYIGANYDVNDINLSPRHTSYNTKQLKAVYQLSGKVNVRQHRDFNIGILNHLRRLCINPVRYGTLYFAKLLPESMFDSDPFIDPEKLEEVKNYFAEDWRQCVEYAKEHNTKLVA